MIIYLTRETDTHVDVWYREPKRFMERHGVRVIGTIWVNNAPTAWVNEYKCEDVLRIFGVVPTNQCICVTCDAQQLKDLGHV